MADATTPGEAGSIAAAAAVATEQTRALRAEIEAADRAGQRFAGSLVTAFEGLAFKGKSLGDVVKSLTLSLSNMVLKAAFADKPRFKKMLALKASFARPGRAWQR